MFDYMTLKDENYITLLKVVADWLEHNDNFELRELNMHMEKDLWVASVWLEDDGSLDGRH